MTIFKLPQSNGGVGDSVGDEPALHDKVNV